MPVFWLNEQKQTPKPHQVGLRLLDYLREELQLTGTKCGCDDHTCGCCTVVIDGKAVRSCHVKLKQLSGKRITTIEGLSKNGRLHPLQAAFVDCGAIQCGFCTPGMIMAAHALLESNKNPSREDIVRGLKVNLCRCGTYNRVIQAVKRAAATLRGEDVPVLLPDELHEEGAVLGRSVPRLDAVGKAKGETKFQDDLYFSQMLHGKIVWSAYPHAKIVFIDTTQAERLPGVNIVLTSRDIPGLNRFGIVEKDQPVLADGKVRFIGEPVVVVFAEDPATAEKGAEAITVAYQELPGVFSPEEALSLGAPKVHEQGNLIKEVALERGKVDAVFQQADVVIDESFATPPLEHAYLETEGALAVPGKNGAVIIYNGNQSPFLDRDQLAAILALDRENIIIRHLPAGGAFGGKLEISVHALVALATLRTGRPTKLILSRTESIRYHPKRHAFDMRYRLAAGHDGKLLGMDIRLISDGGAYQSWSPAVMRLGSAFCTGPYFIPNLRIRGTMAYTNNPVAGAMRGFGGYQTQFAAESAMDILSRKLGINPILLRERNALDVGLPTAVGEILGDGIAYKGTLECIRSCVEKELLPLKEGAENIGIGIASGWRSVAAGTGKEETAGASLELLRNGKILLKTACPELGQGTQTALCQIVSQIVGVDFTDVQIIAGDTEVVPEGGAVCAQRGLYLWGHATAQASHKMHRLLLSESAMYLGTAAEDLDLIKGTIVEPSGQGSLLSLKDLEAGSDRTLSVEEYITLPKTYDYLDDANESSAIDPHDYKVYPAIVYCTTAVAVRVEPASGHVEVLKVFVAVDGGEIINPDAARAQVEGATFMGMGHVLTEEFVVERGYIKTDTLGKCRVPRISITPGELHVDFVKSREPSGPLGSKGVGEAGILSIAPAITNAIYDATGQRITVLPVRKHLAGVKRT